MISTRSALAVATSNRAMRLTRLLGGILLLALLPQCAVAASPPKPILAITELTMMGPHYPWPTDLRFIAYDNGLIILQPEHNFDGLTKPRFIWEHRSPAEIVALVAEAKAAALTDVQVTDQSVSLPFDMGWTGIHYWDAERSELIKVTAYGLPCIAWDSFPKQESVALERMATHPRFLKLCDAILSFASSDAKEWTPEEMVVSLIASPDGSEPTISWPADWPRDWPQRSVLGIRATDICVPVATEQNALTAQALDRRSPLWSQGGAVELSATERWTISVYGSRAVLPAAFDGWPGPCSPAARVQ